PPLTPTPSTPSLHDALPISLTRSTLPPTLLITGRSSRSAPEINAERRPAVPPSRTSRYAVERPTATRNTASASRQRSPHVNAARSEERRVGKEWRSGRSPDK